MRPKLTTIFFLAFAELPEKSSFIKSGTLRRICFLVPFRTIPDFSGIGTDVTISSLIAQSTHKKTLSSAIWSCSVLRLLVVASSTGISGALCVCVDTKAITNTSLVIYVCVNANEFRDRSILSLERVNSVTTYVSRHTQCYVIFFRGTLEKY